jgi:hypothetical protein
LFVNRSAVLLPLAFLAATTASLCQSPGTINTVIAADPGASASAGQEPPAVPPADAAQAPQTLERGKKTEVAYKPFSQLAVGGGISFMGINMQAATNVNRYLNIRGFGNAFSYTINSITVSDFNVNGKVNFATGGVAADYYPFPAHGLRFSVGMLFYNGNQITASGVGTAGSNITLAGQKYYSETADPMTMDATLGLNTRKQAATLTTGWGNMIPRKGGHWSFPFEFGAAFTGVPGINVALSGYGCTNQADAGTYTGAGGTCVNMASNLTAQGYLTTQIAKWESDLNALQVYPIISFGVAYNFAIRK